MKQIDYFRHWYWILIVGCLVWFLGLIWSNVSFYENVLKAQRSFSETVARLIFDNSNNATPRPAVPVRMLFVGDMMFDRHIRLAGQSNGYESVLAPITDFLRSFEVVVGNLETPITDKPSVSLGSEVGSTRNYIFTSDPAIVPALVKNNLTIVNLGNNHIGNMGEEGYRQTLVNLTNGKVDYFGVTGFEGEKTTLVRQIGPVVVGFANYNQFVTGGYERVMIDIEELGKQNLDLVVMYAHWDNEYKTTPAAVTVERARAFIDAGADVVIGSHPHVISAVEEYKGKMIYYSLGNFVFDQYFSEETMTGLMVGLSYNPNTKSIEYQEFRSKIEKPGIVRLVESK